MSTNASNYPKSIAPLMAGNSQVVYHDDDIFICENLSLLPGSGEVPEGKLILLLFCAAGRAQVNMFGATHKVEPGDVLVGPSIDILAECLFSQDFRYAVVGMTMDYITQLMEGGRKFMELLLYIRENPVLRAGEEVHTILPPYALMLDTKIRQHPHPYHKQTVKAIIQSALYDILGYYELQRASDDTVVPNIDAKSNSTGTYTIFKRFLMLLAEDDCRHRTVGYFADQLCITPKYLSAICKQESHRTPLNWIHSALAQRIRHLLLHSDLSIKEIAALLDFPSLSFFGKFVRQHLGASPSAIRAEANNA